MGAAGPRSCPALSACALGQKIARRIRAEGPLSVAAYMAMALHDPDDGYYARREPIGAQGDFITAPEISQVFGELIGLWCALVWRRLGGPDPVTLAELGPGRGVLMSDLLRAAATVPDFRRALRLHLVETSTPLREAQQQRLALFAPIWVPRFEDLPEGPLLLIANEFFDALPIRQFVRRDPHWSERMVALDSENRFVFTEGPVSPVTRLLLPNGLRDSAEEGAIVEVSPIAVALATAIGARFSRHSGAALVIDYGYLQSALGATVRALRRHRAVPELAEPGTADLSAHVDFAAFAQAARNGGAEVYGPVPQTRLLTALGVVERAAALRAAAGPSQQQALDRGVERLIDPDGMGTLFKAVALVSPGLPAPPGFDPLDE
jgi:NADH dehydrogenase [ubiquinone] 1 alpha subcomplex assembly factor 7